METGGLLPPLHLAFGGMDTHTRLLVYARGFGPFFLLLLVTFVHARRASRNRDDATRAQADRG